MKLSFVVAALSLVSISSLVSVAQAERAKDAPACASLVKSCEAAGYSPGAHKKTGKGLWVDCVHAIAEGKTVAGVTATQAEAKACQEAAKADHAANKAAKSH